MNTDDIKNWDDVKSYVLNTGDKDKMLAALNEMLKIGHQGEQENDRTRTSM